MKSCLLITPNFNGLDALLLDAIRKKFCDVDHFFDRPSSFFFKAVLRINVPIVSRVMTGLYYKRIFRSLRNNYDVAIIINPESLTRSNLDIITKRASKTVVYFWDGSVTKPTIKTYAGIHGLNCYSFDKGDCNTLGFKYLPLFVPDEYGDSTEFVKDVDVCFIASCHGRRLILANALYHICVLSNYEFVIRLTSPSIVHFLYYNVIAKIRNYKVSVTYSALPHERYIDLICRSKVVVDMTSDPMQSGVSLRSFEALGRGCKLLTDNQFIQNEEFFDESLIAFFFDLPTLEGVRSSVDKVPASFDKSKLTLDYFVNRLLA